ncbi:DMT family transporter [Peribacillus kribbensis]|uniref:DMT family transporter n=1 Tax=Peribacillus kribbensis TaxID=356658 RepID=UPI0004284948|nr:DMT family transporter [Peribacillus kribbensis]
MTGKEFAALLTLAALWGASFLFIRVASPELGPFLTVELRVALAAAALLIYAVFIKYTFSFRAHWKKYIMVGLLNAAVPFAFITGAELHLTASMASIINATTPMFTAAAAWVWFKTRLSMQKFIGMLIGIAGVVILVGWSTGKTDGAFMLSALYSLLAALFYGIAGNYIAKNFKEVKPMDLAIGQQIGASIVMLPFTLFTLPRSLPSVPALLSVLVLAVLCTSLAYLLYFYLMGKSGALKTASVTFLVPIFGVGWGALFLKETIRANTIFGMLVIFAGILLVTGILGRRKMAAG